MKKTCSLLAVLVSLYTVAQQPALIKPLAFPGAEGFGANTAGGRGGKIFVINTLADSGPGSLREACEAQGARMVVFNVSGIIDLQTPLVIANPYITIAAQTAPGEGICLKRRELKISAHDVIVRYIRSRPGNIAGKELDAISIVDGAHDVILDHCTANWSVDEGLSPSGDIYNITVQWCLIGKALLHSVHKKGAHGYGSLVRGTGGITLHHNLWLDNSARNPRLGDNYNKPPWPVIDVRNNVMYNWGKICTGMTGGNISVNYVANYLKPGPQSSQEAPIVLTKTSQVKFYLSDNVVEGRPQFTAKHEAMFDDGGDSKLFQIFDKPFDVPFVKTTSAANAYADVVAHAGANKPVRDAIDKSLLQEVITNTGKMIDSQDDMGGWPVYRNYTPHIDSDADGIPDEWERKYRLDTQNPNDAQTLGKDGYSNIERYMNSMAE